MIESFYMDEEQPQLSHLANLLITTFEKEEDATGGNKTITVNRVISEVASWYEKLRNSMDIREEEVILRAAIERIVKRRILLGGAGKKIAAPLVRELIWARYFPDASVPEAIIAEVERSIDLHLHLRAEIAKHKQLKEHIVNEWFYHLLSVDLVNVLSPNPEKDTMANFMFKLLSESVTITDDSRETRDAQVFIAVRKSFAKDDVAFLRYHLVHQYFGTITMENVAEVGSNFATGYKEIEHQLAYPLKNAIFSYIRKKTPPFYILDDILRTYPQQTKTLFADQTELKKVVFAECAKRYNSIAGKVRTAIIRSVIFLLLTKAIFAFLIEGTYETVHFGHISWGTLALNISIPPLLMVIVGLLIKTPGRDNSERIFTRIQSILFDEKSDMGNPLTLEKIPTKTKPLLDLIFRILWLLAFGLSFGVMLYVLNLLHFNIVSQGIFVFFVTIVSFLAYRISQTATIYLVDPRPGLITPIIDFFFLPIVQVGQHLTDGIAQFNLILFIFDFIIETPFKGIFSFFEQWFLYLNRKRETLG